MKNIKILLIVLFCFNHTIFSGPAMSAEEVPPLKINQRTLRIMLRDAIKKSDSYRVGLITPHMSPSSINKRDDKGLTPLHYAVISKNNSSHKIAIIENLISCGSDPKKYDAYGNTPLELAEAMRDSSQKCVYVDRQDVLVMDVVFEAVSPK